MSQLSIPFAATETEDLDTVTYRPMAARKATFKSGVDAAVHRWFRLTPSFGPDLVREMLDSLNYGDGEVVLDPFSGAGTTQIECQLLGIQAFGFEINPLLSFVGSTCLNWQLSIDLLRSILNSISEQYRANIEEVTFDSLSDLELEIPAIHNPTRWWRKDVLAQLLYLKKCICEAALEEEYRNFYLLALAGVLVPDLTNVTLSRLQLHFIDREGDDIQVWKTFHDHAISMIEDINDVQQAGLNRTASIFHADSTCIGASSLPKNADCVITSPPYPNRYSYVWNTRPHLFFLDLFSNARQSSDLDKRTIGGTWGTATSVLNNGIIEPVVPIVHEVVSPVVEGIRESSNLMANYTMKYFNLLTRQILAMEHVLSPDARVAYVVGCSRLKGVFIETDIMLAKILEGLGLNYKISEVRRIRRRNSGKNLYESVVYAWKERS